MQQATTMEQDITCSITAKVTPDDATDKIGRVSEWWIRQTEGNSKARNDVFTVRFPGESFVTFTITEMDPKKKIVWHAADCYLPWLNNKTEWTGTDVIFDITAEGENTRIDFRHRGLTPQVECYDQCVKGWNQYVPGSLLRFLTEGKGLPS
ncbi:MAG TPA: SRPBCC domain-containing protein [Candidatus Kapabacteria bacterium]|nr:SRPBCC domain-containing protein [Candidatus Kapabacteria bacterium]